MRRNRGVDIFRTGALLLVLLYHAWHACGRQPINNSLVNMIVILGGELGVTAFFCLSGFGIFCSLQSMDNKNTLSFKTHIYKRITRVAPQYYINLIVMLLFGGAAVYLSNENISNVLTHILFVHNFWPAHHGAINGVLWTMGVMFQFYVIAILLYKIMKKNPILFWGISVVATIAMKYIAFEFIAPTLVADTSLNFFLGRQLPTALDNFTTGMFVAYLVSNIKETEKKSIIGYIVVIIGVIITILFCNYGLLYGIHTNNISGYIWHSEIAIALGVTMLGFSMISIPESNWLVKIILWISEIEYGVYLWHLPLFYSLVSGSGWIQGLLAMGQRKIVILVLISIAIVVGGLFTKMTDSFVKDLITRKEEK